MHDEGQVVGTAHERQPEPAAGRSDEARHERQRGRQGCRDPDPLEDPGHDERPRRAARLDAGKQDDQAPDHVREPGPGEGPDAAEAVDRDAGHEGRRDLDQGRRPDDDADLRVGDARPGERDGQRGGEPVEAGLHGEQRKGEAEHAPIIGEWRRVESPAPAVRALAGRRVGGAGKCRRALVNLAAEPYPRT